MTKAICNIPEDLEYKEKILIKHLNDRIDRRLSDLGMLERVIQVSKSKCFKEQQNIADYSACIIDEVSKFICNLQYRGTKLITSTGLQSLTDVTILCELRKVISPYLREDDDLDNWLMMVVDDICRHSSIPIRRKLIQDSQETTAEHIQKFGENKYGF